MRINRYLSEAGLGSRRSVESLVRSGRVRVNGVRVTNLAVKVDPGRDRVEVDGRRVDAAVGGKVLLLHKPAGVVCSFRKQGTSPILPEILPADVRSGRWMYVGRLDRDTTGLLLLTDDGDLAHGLTHPSREVWKRYRVDLDAPLAPEALDGMRKGTLRLAGVALAPVRIRRMGGRAARYRLWLREGRNRQIRRMMERFGRSVQALHREAYGPLVLTGLAAGEMREASRGEVRALRAAAGLDAPAAGD